LAAVPKLLTPSKPHNKEPLHRGLFSFVLIIKYVIINNMSEIMAINVETLPAETEPSRKEKVVRYVGCGLIGGTVIAGPITGAILGHDSINAAKSRLPKSEAQLGKQQTALDNEHGRLGALLFVDLPTKCASGLKAYLPGGADESFSTAEAQLSLQESHLCAPTDTSLVSGTRKIYVSIAQDQRQIAATEHQLTGEHHEATHHSKIYEDALGGLGFSVWGVALEACVIGGFLDS
jgi:hypothetical protein